MEQFSTELALSPKQISVLEALVTADPSESMEETASRAGVSRGTIYRYLDDKDFRVALDTIVRQSFQAHKHKVANALIKGALNPGNGQGALQKLYWQLGGDLIERSEVEHKGSIELHWGNTPVELRMLILNIADGKLDPKVVDVGIVKGWLAHSSNNKLTGSVDSSSREVFDEVEDDTIDVGSKVICSRVGDIYQGVELRKVVGFVDGSNDTRDDTSNLHTTNRKVRL